jgi:hypothetical protein
MIGPRLTAFIRGNVRLFSIGGGLLFRSNRRYEPETNDGTHLRFTRDSPLEGEGFEPSVPWPPSPTPWSVSHIQTRS